MAIRVWFASKKLKQNLYFPGTQCKENIFQTENLFISMNQLVSEITEEELFVGTSLSEIVYFFVGE